MKTPANPPYEGSDAYKKAKSRSHKFPVERPPQKILRKIKRKQEESIPLERKQRRLIGVPSWVSQESLILHDRPYGEKAVKYRHQGKDVYVYLYRIEPRSYTGEAFLKIGITRSKGERFNQDFFRYKFDLLGFVSVPNRRDALKIERGLHRMFADMQYIPKLRLLSGGNSECFYYHDGIVERCLLAFKLFREEIDRIKGHLKSRCSSKEEYSPRKAEIEVQSLAAAPK